MKKGCEGLKKLLGKRRLLAMLAPSFVAEFDYPYIVRELRRIGFDKIVELTFGAKMINRYYHEQLKGQGLLISSVCPGVVEEVMNKFPQYRKNLAKIDSPMAAMAKICRRNYPKHKIVFISPCFFKKSEAQKSKEIDYVIDYQELWGLIKSCSLKSHESGREVFDTFYNDYTKVYPLAGGLSKTTHLKGIIKPEETLIVDGIDKVRGFLNSPGKKIRFLDATFCNGGCIGGPCLKRFKLAERKKRVIRYMKESKRQDIPEERKGIIDKARGIKFARI